MLFAKFSKTKIDLPRALKQFVLYEFFVSHNINSSHDIEYRPIRFLWICSYTRFPKFYFTKKYLNSYSLSWLTFFIFSF